VVPPVRILNLLSPPAQIEDKARPLLFLKKISGSSLVACRTISPPDRSSICAMLLNENIKEERRKKGISNFVGMMIFLINCLNCNEK
jgi:hypothetical protein